MSDLISELPNTNNYSACFFDNLFTSLPLMKHLDEHDYSGTGTIRGIREGAPFTEPALMKKKERRECCQLTDDTMGITLVQWHDNSIVTVASNCFGIEPIQKAKR